VGVGPEATSPWATTQDVEVVGSSWSISTPLVSTGPYHRVLQGRFDCPSSLAFQSELSLNSRLHYGDLNLGLCWRDWCLPNQLQQQAF